MVLIQSAIQYEADLSVKGNRKQKSSIERVFWGEKVTEKSCSLFYKGGLALRQKMKSALSVAPEKVVHGQAE